MSKVIKILILSVLTLYLLAPQIYPIQATGIELRKIHKSSEALMDIMIQPHGTEVSYWSTECVDCPKKFTNLTDHSLRIDTAGNPHISYGGDHLYYTHYDGLQWHIEVVDSSPQVGAYASLYLDKHGSPYISYQDTSRLDLKFAHREGTSWHVETIDSNGETGFYTSIALDVSGFAHITYYDQTNGDLKYAFQDSAGWQIQTVESTGNVGQNTSLALDQNGHPHISYSDLSNDRVKYATLYESNWQIHSVNIDSSHGHTSLALDGIGNPHITYSGCEWVSEGYRGSTEICHLKYSILDGGIWHHRHIDCQTTSGFSITIDTQDYPHISYICPPWSLNHFFLDSTGWQIESFLADDFGDDITAVSSSLAMDGNNLPHITYLIHFSSQIEGSRTLKYATREMGDWNKQSVDSAYIAERSSLSLDKENNAHISFRADFPTRDELRYASHDSSGWNIQKVTEFKLIHLIAMDLDSHGNPHLSYSGIGFSNELFYAFQNELDWNIQKIFSGVHGDSVKNVSLFLDTNGSPHISLIYYNIIAGGENGILLYGYQDNDGWHYETVDHGILVSGRWGDPFTLILDQYGKPHISYSTHSDLMYAYLEQDIWHIQTIVSDQFLPLVTSSLAIDSQSFPHFSFLKTDDDWTTHLVHVYWDGEKWHENSILPIEYPEYNPTLLVLDEQDYAHIGFTWHTGSTYYPIYIYQNASGWHVHQLDHLVNSKVESFDMNSEGFAQFSVVDNNGLKFTYQTTPLRGINLSTNWIQGYKLPESTITYSLQVTNTGQITDTLILTLDEATWATSVPTTTGALAVGQDHWIDIQVTIPPTTALGTSDTATITLTSQSDPSVSASARLTTYATITTYLPLVER